MKRLLFKSLVMIPAMAGWIVLGSWSGGPAPECKNDSLAIVRVIRPVNELFKVKPVVFVSKGSGKIDEVQVTDAEFGSDELVLKQTLTDLLTNGYTIQTATETYGDGMKLNTYYLRKKVI